MKAQPLVSIIIDNYNYGRFLEDAIESSIHQPYPHLEVIVVDDGSTDESRDIIKGYGERIISLLKENGGQASCFNEGFKISKGEIIIFLDADDYLENNAVKKIVEAVNGKNNISKAHWILQKVDQDKKLKKQTLPDSSLAHGNLRKQLIQHGPSQCGGPPNSPPTSGNAWTRNFLEKVLPMPEEEFRGGADKYLFVLAPLYGDIVKIEEALGYYRLHGGNNTVKSTYITSYFNRFEKCCTSLSEHLDRMGIHIDPATWPRDHWYHKVYAAMNIVKEKTKENSSFILMDDNHWMTENDFYNRTRIPFTEKYGVYAGPPADDNSAISEIEKQKVNGADYLVIPWSCFWYLNYFKEMTRHIQTNYTCIVDHELVRIFDLQNHAH